MRQRRPSAAAAFAACLPTSVFVAGTLASPSLTIDFDTDPLGNTLEAGTGFDSNAYAAIGVTISGSSRFDSPLNLFDSGFGDLPRNAPGGRGTGGDEDLGTGARFGSPNLGNILIFQELRDNPLGNPDDDAAGGEVTFHFADGADEISLTLVDIDENRDVGFRALLADGTVAEIDPLGSTLVNPGFPGNNAVRVLDFSFLDEPVVAFGVDLTGFSGAIGELSFRPAGINIPAPAVAAGLSLAGVTVARRGRRGTA